MGAYAIPSMSDPHSVEDTDTVRPAGLQSRNRHGRS